MALWKAKSLSPEQKVRIVEEESEERELQSEESGSFLGIEEAKMSEVFSAIVPVAVSLSPTLLTTIVKANAWKY